jgi:Asp-tRNA(Asn)/Glu-tRNA(Gln) amidotransferase B subunit
MSSSSISIYTRLEDKNMDERDIVLNSVLEELKNKKQITDLEKDIISAIKVFLEQPIDRNNVKTKINEIDLKYNTYSDLLMVMPQDSLCTLDELNDAEMRNNLYLRINALLGRRKVMAFNEQFK